MKLRSATLAATVALVSGVVASSAMADGYSRPRSVYAPGPLTSWTGFYIGGHAGGAWSEVDWRNVNLTGERVNNDASGFIGGGQIGYNQQFGSIVLGVEGTLSATTLGDDFRSVKNPAVTYSTDINSIATLTGRLGFAADQWLVYAKAGWAGAQVDVSGRNTALPDSFSIGDWHNGWTVGGGLEYKVARNISLAVEYSFIDLGTDHLHGRTALATPVNIVDYDVQIQSITARLNFHFYRDEYRAEPRPLK
jgi:outer membrane immunogenic protein